MLKKLMALLLALIMVFGMTAMIFADGTEGFLLIPEAPEEETDILFVPEPEEVIDITAPEPSMAGKTVILHTNDVHGVVAGYTYAAKLKADYEAMGAEVILADAGDFMQGSPYVSASKGADAVVLMNAAGYDVATLGNHEFDYGYTQLKENLSKAEFRIVCANVLENDNPIFDPYTIFTMKSGLKVAFVGVETPETKTKANPAYTKGLTLLDNTLFDEIQKQIDAAAEEADLVFVLAHLGIDSESEPYTSSEFAANVTGYAYLLDAHSHTVMTEGPNGEAAQSTGIGFANIGIIVIDNETKKIESHELKAYAAPEIRVNEDKTVSVTIAAEDGEDKVLGKAIEIMSRVEKEYGQAFAVSKVKLNGEKSIKDGVYGNRDGETNAGDFMADAMLWQASKDGGITVDADHIVSMNNGGGIRAALLAGDITKNDIHAVQPFDNTVAVVYVTGAELLEVLEASTYSLPNSVGGFPQVSGIEYTVSTGLEYKAAAEPYPDSTYYGPTSINRVKINNINGKPFAIDDVYAVVTHSFCAAGGDTYYALASASAQFDTGIPVDEAVMDYIKTELGGVIGEEYAKPQGRIHIITHADLDMNKWYADAVTYVIEEGYAIGKDTGFGPNDVITKAEVLTLLYRMAGTPDAAFVEGYDDLMADQWYTDAVCWALENEMIKADGTEIGIAKACPREEAASMIYKLIQAQGGGFKGMWMFNWEKTDKADVDPEYLEACMFMDVNKIMVGQSVTTFNPKAEITRAEVCQILYNYLKIFLPQYS